MKPKKICKKAAAVILAAAISGALPYAAYANENEQTVLINKEASGSFTENKAEKFIISDEGRKLVCRAVSDAMGDSCVPVSDKLTVGKGEHSVAVRYRKMYYDENHVTFPIYGEEGLYGLLYTEYDQENSDMTATFRPLPAYLLKYKYIVPYTVQPNTWFHYHVVSDSNEFYSVSVDTAETTYYEWNDNISNYEVITRLMQDEYADRINIMSEGLS